MEHRDFGLVTAGRHLSSSAGPELSGSSHPLSHTDSRHVSCDTRGAHRYRWYPGHSPRYALRNAPADSVGHEPIRRCDGALCGAWLARWYRENLRVVDCPQAR